jgi:hypothetical protein
MLFTRLFFKLALIVALIFAAFIAAIRAQPYDDSELRAFLTPEGCPAPCFMGIRPGVTTMEESLVILEGHEWVGDITPNYDDEKNLRKLGWKWAENKSKILRDSAFLLPDKDAIFVDEIHIFTYFDASLVIYYNPNPQNYYISVLEAYNMDLQVNENIIEYIVDYHPKEFFSFKGYGYCPYKSTLWDYPLEIVISHRGFVAPSYFFAHPSFQNFMLDVKYWENQYC